MGLLLLIAVVYALFTLPANAMFVYLATHPDVTVDNASTAVLFSNKLAKFLEVVNYSSNFYLYFIYSHDVLGFLRRLAARVARRVAEVKCKAHSR